VTGDPLKSPFPILLICMAGAVVGASGCGVRDGRVSADGTGPKVVAASTGYAFPNIGTRRKPPTGVPGVDAAEAASATKPDDPATRKALGLAYYATGGYRAAAGALEKVVGATPSDGEAWLYLGFARMGAGMPESAVEALDRAATSTLPPAARASALSEAGTVLYQAMRDDRKAMDHFRRALALDKREGAAALALGTDAAQRKDRPGAKAFFETAAQALQPGPDRASVYACLGRLCEENSDTAGAQQWYRKAVADDPGNAWARTRVKKAGN